MMIIIPRRRVGQIMADSMVMKTGIVGVMVKVVVMNLRI